ncbi:unnamed protein product [Mucor hiemalis]
MKSNSNKNSSNLSSSVSSPNVLEAEDSSIVTVGMLKEILKEQILDKISLFQQDILNEQRLFHQDILDQVLLFRQNILKKGLLFQPFKKDFEQQNTVVPHMVASHKSVRRGPVEINPLTLHELCADDLKQRYGTSKQRKNLIRNPNKNGKRNLVKPRGAGVKKAPFMDTMKKYYIMHKNSSEDFVPSDDELKTRYLQTLYAVKLFVSVQIIPGNPYLTSVSNIPREERDLHFLMVEDYIESKLGSGKDGKGLPLFCTQKHYGAIFFLTSTIQSVLRENGTRRSPWNKERAVGGPIKSNLYYDTLLGRTPAANDGIKVKSEEVKQESIGTM